MIKGYMTAGDGKKSPLLNLDNFQISLEKVGPKDDKTNPPQLIGKNDWVEIEKALESIDKSELLPGCFYELLLDWNLRTQFNEPDYPGQPLDKIIFEVVSINMIDTDKDDLPF